jgi:hypothetical protein
MVQFRMKSKVFGPFSVLLAALVAKYNFFVLEVVKAWIDPQVSAPRTLHHRGRGEFMVAGRTLRLRSRAK